jgi:hypothetical protein
MASTAVMSADTAVDLALLGLLAERPRSLHELVGCIKLVGGDRFTPTSALHRGPGRPPDRARLHRAAGGQRPA